MKFDIRNIDQKWFSDTTPKNYKDASITIGAGDNGVITVTAINDITDDKTIEVVVGSGNNVAMSADYTDGELVVTLGTGAAGAVADAKNTATLIAAAIDALAGFTATASGTGATAITEAVTEKAFTTGQLGTPCTEIGVGFVSSGTYYVNTKADYTTYNDGWRTFTLTDY